MAMRHDVYRIMPRVACKSVPAGGFWRAGLRWSPDGALNYGAEVSEEQLAELQAETLLHVTVLGADAPKELPKKK